MTDIHSHIIFGIDDGSKSVEESLEIINKLSFLGFNNIICTPHFIEGTEYCANNEEKEKRLNILKEKSNVNLYFSNEIYINTRIDKFIENGYIMPINKKYLLVEFPMHNEIKDAIDIFYELQIKGYTIILAHPERYTFFQDDYKLIDKYHEKGILFQANFGSANGMYGHEAEKLLKYLLKKGWIHFLGTDVHHSNSKLFDEFNKIEKKLIKYAGKEYYQNIIDNGDKLIK